MLWQKNMCKHLSIQHNKNPNKLQQINCLLNYKFITECQMELIKQRSGSQLQFVRKQKVPYLYFIFMVTLCNRADHYIFILFLSSSFFFSSPNLSGRRLDVYHTLAHGVTLVRI